MALSSIILLALVVGLTMALETDESVLKTWTEKVEGEIPTDVQPATLIGDYKVSQLYGLSTFDPRFSIIKHEPVQNSLSFSSSQSLAFVNNIIGQGDPMGSSFQGEDDFTGSLKACKAQFPHRSNARRVAVTITDGCYDDNTGDIANAANALVSAPNPVDSYVIFKRSDMKLCTLSGVANSQAMAPAANRFIEVVSENYNAAVDEFVKNMYSVCKADFEYPKTVNSAFQYANAVCQPSKLTKGCATEDELVAAEGRTRT